MNIDKEALTQAVIKLQNGDGQAFNDVYNLTNQAAFFTAKSITKNADDAYDVLQESYVKALDKINTVDKPESFMSWFNMIVANKAREMMRKKKPLFFDDYVSEDEDGNLSVQNIIPDEEDDVIIPGADVEREEVRKEVMNLINGLSDEKRTAVILHYYNDMPVAEIADSLGVSENTIKSRLFQARKDLKAGIEALEKKNKSIFGIAPMSLVRWALNTDSMGADSKLPDPAELYSRIQAANVPDFSAFGRLTDKISDVFLKISEKFHTLFSNGVDPKPVAAIVVTAGIVGGAIAGTNAVKNRKEETTAVVTTEDTTKMKVPTTEAPSFEFKEDKKVDNEIVSQDLKYGVKGSFQAFAVKNEDGTEIKNARPMIDRKNFKATYEELLPAADENREIYSDSIDKTLDQINSMRGPGNELSLDSVLTETANVRAEEIAWSGRNYAIRPDGSDFTTVFEKNGINDGNREEVIAYKYADAGEANKKWQKDDISNILKNPDIQKIGIGVAKEPESEKLVFVIHLYSDGKSNKTLAERFKNRLAFGIDSAANEQVDNAQKSIEMGERIEEAVAVIPIIGDILLYDFDTDEIEMRIQQRLDNFIEKIEEAAQE